MKTATFVKNCGSPKGEARLYKVVENAQVSYIRVSAVDVPYSGPETYIFAADADGEVLNWGELNGSFQGGLDHEKALRLGGYVVETATNKEV